jgi:hypothetical protein
MSELPPRSSMQSSVYSDQRMARAKSILEKNLNKSRGAEVNAFNIHAPVLVINSKLLEF